MARRRLFLDVDGVLLGTTSGAVQLAAHAETLLRLAIGRFDARWLTTHGADGSIEPILRHLRAYCSPSVLDLVRQIPAAPFVTLKVEAFVGAGADFVWLDDAPLAVELQWLVERGLLANLIVTDTRRRPDDLAAARPARSSTTPATPRRPISPKRASPTRWR